MRYYILPVKNFKCKYHKTDGINLWFFIDAEGDHLFGKWYTVATVTNYHKKYIKYCNKHPEFEISEEEALKYTESISMLAELGK